MPQVNDLEGVNVLAKGVVSTDFVMSGVIGHFASKYTKLTFRYREQIHLFSIVH